MNIVYKSVDELIPYEKNTKKHDKKQIKNVATSIDKYGFVQPLVIDKNNVVIIGHCRLLGAKHLKMDKVPCVCAEDLTEEEVNALRIVDNKSNESEWDMDVLADELGNVDLSAFDFDFDFVIDEEDPKEVVEDDVPEIDEEAEPITKMGDIWQLGRHRLMCGDSTDSATVERLMDGAKVDLVFTDPPYRMEAQGGSEQWVGQQAKKLGESIKDLCDFDPAEFLCRLKEVFQGNMNAYVFCNKDLVPDYLSLAVENGYSFNILFWKKPNALPLGGQHRPDTEYLLFFRKNAIWNNGVEGVSYSKCLEFGRDHSTPHPTMKPLELICNELKISSNKKNNILDFFGGSGSTLIACEQLDRNCFMMELDPKYCDVIVKRWETLTGEKAVLIKK